MHVGEGVLCWKAVQLKQGQIDPLKVLIELFTLQVSQNFEDQLGLTRGTNMLGGLHSVISLMKKGGWVWVILLSSSVNINTHISN